MKKIKKEVLRVYEYIKKFELSNKQTIIIKEASDSMKNKEIDFEEYIRRIIPVHESNLIFKKRSNNNKEILIQFLNIFTIINEHRWLDGKYQSELEPISKQIKEVEKMYGLSEDEYFTIHEAPKEIKNLNKKYENILDQKEREVIKEFLSDNIYKYFSETLFALKNRKKKEGREQSIKIKRKNKEREVHLMEIYYREFKECYKHKLYTAATAMLGASFESLLISLLEKNEECKEKINSMYEAKIIKKNKLYNLHLEDLIIVGSSLGIIPNIEYREKIILLKGFSDDIRSARNLIHPGKILREEALIRPLIAKKELDILHDIFQIVKKVNSVS